MFMFSGNNCQPPRSRPFVSILMELPPTHGSDNYNSYNQDSFWSNIYSTSPLKPCPQSSLENGFHLNGFSGHNGSIQHKTPIICTFWICAVRFWRMIAAGVHCCYKSTCKRHIDEPPVRVYGISSDTDSSSERRFIGATAPPRSEPPSTKSPMHTSDSPPYMPSYQGKYITNSHIQYVNGNNGQKQLVRDLPV